MMAYFSQWIMDEAYAENLLPDNTHLAKALASLGLKYTFHNLTDSGLRHWKKKLAVLEDMREAFAKEGIPHFGIIGTGKPTAMPTGGIRNTAGIFMR
ncbi:MAG: hypothetical protein IPJ40_19395 [Saprospirales bacterium]|nr:hypothetical protein [Saprospirales bacterium]